MSEHAPSARPMTAAASAPPTRRPDGLTAPSPSFSRLVGVELRKAVDTVAGRWLLILTVVLVIGAIGINLASAVGGGVHLHTVMSNALVPVALLVPVMGVLMMSGEFSNRTLLVTFTLVSSRGRVMAAKAFAAVVGTVGVTVLAGMLAVAAAGGLSLGGEPVRWSVEPAVLGQLVALQVVNVLVGVAFGLLLQSTALGVVAFLLVPLLAGFVLLVPALRDFAPWFDLATGTEALSLDSVAARDEWLTVLSVTAVWAGLPSALGWLRMRRREIT